MSAERKPRNAGKGSSSSESRVEAKNPPGPPTKYSKETADLICAGLMEGYSLRKICAAEDMPACSTVFKWLAENVGFSEQYARARDIQADVMADELVDISDDGSNDTYEDDDGYVKTNYDVIARSRLRVDTRKWVASKLKPKKYGDLKQVEHSGTVSLEGLVCGDEDRE